MMFDWNANQANNRRPIDQYSSAIENISRRMASQFNVLLDCNIEFELLPETETQKGTSSSATPKQFYSIITKLPSQPETTPTLPKKRKRGTETQTKTSAPEHRVIFKL